MRETFFILGNASVTKTFTLRSRELNEFGRYNTQSLALEARYRLSGGREAV